MASTVVLSFLDAPVVTGPARGLIHLGRALPPDVRLHVAILRGKGAGPVPRLDELSGGAVTVHEIQERGAYDPGIVARAAAIAWRVDARVVQSHSYKPHLIAMAVRAVKRVPWVGHHHGWTAENDKVKRYHRIDAWSLPRANRVVAVANSARDIVVHEGVAPEKVVVIPNAVDARDISTPLSRDEARAALGIPAGDFVAAVVGRLSHEKGQDLALRALASARAQGADVTFALAGDGPDREMLEGLAKELGLGLAVRFLGHQKQVGVVYKACDMLVMPSRSEAMPNALLEAMTLGLPVVATRVGGVPEVADDGEMAWIVEPESADALARAVVDCVARPDERARRVAQARARTTERHDPARRAERYLSLYAALGVR
ncbi:MAG: glycosyl transferase group 1 [Myxococcaceae bacterium]|nr:glycosyl transferase group 1 [Myxococcaceae bacterium]